jgi:hypothetical protein
MIEHTYDEFKTNILNLKDIDGSKNINNLIGEDLSDAKIKTLMHLNGFSAAALNGMHFSVKTIDDRKGIATICVDQSDVPDYFDKTFQIFNLKPYFIEQNKKIPASLSAKKPSEISELDFKNDLIKMSDEFKNRHINDLLISLKPDDQKRTLMADITFTDVKTQQVTTLTYVYDFNKSSIN